jgi:hypothetical protein
VEATRGKKHERQMDSYEATDILLHWTDFKLTAMLDN